MENGQKPAFPDPMRGAEQSIINQSPHHEAQGMTLREYYAGLAMQGILSCPNRWLTDDKEIECNPEQVAGISLEYADALLKALETKTE